MWYFIGMPEWNSEEVHKPGSCFARNILKKSSDPPPSSLSCSSCSANALSIPITTSARNSEILSMSFMLKSSGTEFGLASLESILKLRKCTAIRNQMILIGNPKDVLMYFILLQNRALKRDFPKLRCVLGFLAIE
jgi:hypothetical protein